MEHDGLTETISSSTSTTTTSTTVTSTVCKTENNNSNDSNNANPTSTSGGENDKTLPSSNTYSPSLLSNSGKNEKSGLPKAMVKPHVLTHVIEGFVIQEANEAFPVTRQRYPERDAADEPPNKMQKTNNTSNTTGNSDDPNTNGPTTLGALGTGNGITLQCENCGKIEQACKMKKKRFCSMSCAKASKTSQSTDSTTSSSSSGDSIPLANLVESNQSANKKPQIKEEKLDDKLSNGLSSSSSCSNNNININNNRPLSPTMMLGGEEAPLIVKWTVADVCEFIKNLPGCCDYADDFAIQEIDGQALLLLKENHLVNAMGMKLGPALKIVAKVDSMRIGCNGEKDQQN